MCTKNDGKCLSFQMTGIPVRICSEHTLDGPFQSPILNAFKNEKKTKSKINNTYAPSFYVSLDWPCVWRR